ncbi:MAG TPA: hypothetical protein VHM93_09975 [Candidatus Acidoferrum sp.]|jgi:membrane protein YdbS with pleckstrin-like domain|nr:hypothetical protein [Candidatus Acidoferrum sp.]
MNLFSSDTMLQFPGELWTLLGVVLAFLLLAVLAPTWCENAQQGVLRLLSRLAGRKTLLFGVLFFGVIGVRLAVLPLLPIPVPGIHDEFSYLLLGDTLAHGRLTNPTHPMWMSFESFHINWFPTYSSKYPPGQGVVLALGELLGLPWVGVILSVAAMCAATLWMLQAWLPPKWALLGAALVAVKFGIANYWMNSYWGGAVAATGGALVLGAMPRLVRDARTRDALLLGLGLAVLANTRPYEGLLFSVPVGVWFFWWLAGKTKSTAIVRTRMTGGLAPLAVVLVSTLMFMGYYNWRLTGNAFLFPHALNTRTYRTTGLFLWDHPKPPLHYHNQQFEDFYNGWERENYQNTWPDVWRVSGEKLTRSGSTYFWWGALLLLPGLPFAVRDRKMRLPVVLFLLGAAGFFVLIWSMPHYAAPTTSVIFLLLVQSIRHLRTIRLSGRPVGFALSCAAVCLLAVEVGFQVANRSCDPLGWTCQGDPSRAAIHEKLSHTPGKHLIVVRYGEDHNIHDEWVYNGAEIDSAKVLWARELDPEQNAKLLSYFKERHVWLVEPDKDNTELTPYTPPPEQ